MKGGVFRGIKSQFAKMFARSRTPIKRTTEHPDPVLRDPYTKPRLRARIRGKPKVRLGRPPCDPGTITFHDKMVRLYGRREADRIWKKYQDGDFDDENIPF